MKTGRHVKTEPTLEYEERRLINVSAADFTWQALSTNAWFKIVCDGDAKLMCRLIGEDAFSDAELKALGAFVFKDGEGSNAKVLKVFKDAGNTLPTAMWAVR